MCITIMNSSKTILNLLAILAIGCFSFQEALAVDDLDDTLKQAIFLVKLLKSGKIAINMVSLFILK